MLGRLLSSLIQIRVIAHKEVPESEEDMKDADKEAMIEELLRDGYSECPECQVWSDLHPSQEVCDDCGCSDTDTDDDDDYDCDDDDYDSYYDDDTGITQYGPYYNRLERNSLKRLTPRKKDQGCSRKDRRIGIASKRS